jgi:hypothetical protein
MLFHVRTPSGDTMSERPKENAPRGDHVPGGPNDDSAAEMNQKAEAGKDPEPAPAPDAGVRGREEKADPSLGG